MLDKPEEVEIGRWCKCTYYFRILAWNLRQICAKENRMILLIMFQRRSKYVTVDNNIMCTKVRWYAWYHDDHVLLRPQATAPDQFLRKNHIQDPTSK